MQRELNKFKIQTISLMLMASLICSLPMAACSVINQPGLSTAILAGTTKDEKALYVAESAYNGASQAIKIALDTKVLVGGSAKAIQVADLDDKAFTALTLARKAIAEGNSSDYKSQVEFVLSTVSQIKTLLP